MINRRSSRRRSETRSFSLLDFLTRGRKKRLSRRQQNKSFEAAEFATATETLEDRTLLSAIGLPESEAMYAPGTTLPAAIPDAVSVPADNHKHEDGSSEPFVVEGRDWGAGATVTYGFTATGVVQDIGVNTSVGAALPAGSTAEITRALAHWASVANIKFAAAADSGLAFNAAEAAGDAQIRFGTHTFDGPSGTLAHGFFPPVNGVSAAGDIHYDNAEAWKIGYGGPGFDVFQVTAHEIGHAIGLSHQNPAPAALMNPFYTETFVGVQMDDVLGAQAIYGAAVIPNLVISAANDPLHGNQADDGTPDVFRIVRRGGVVDVFVNGRFAASVDYASLTDIVINGSGDDDKLIVDESGGKIERPISFHGGANGAGGDELEIQGGAYTTVTSNFTNGSDGNVDLDGSVITYTGLEPVLINVGSAANMVFNLPAAATVANLEDDGAVANGLSRLRSGNGTFETTTFVNPTNSLTINAQANADRINITALDNGYAASTRITDAGGADTLIATSINISGTSGTGLRVDDIETVNVSNSTFNSNAVDGLHIGLATTVFVSNVTANSNDFHGFIGHDISGTTTITGGTFNNNDANNNNTGDGIHLLRMGAVITTGGVTATGNDPGISIIDAASYSDTDGNFSGNDDHGIFLQDISGDVTLTRTTLLNNDANNGGVGDGLHAVDGGDPDTLAIGGKLTVNGLTAGTTGVGHQERGVYVESIGGGVLFETAVDPISIQNNEFHGVEIHGDGGNGVQFLGGDYSNNGGDGLNLSDISHVFLERITSSSNAESGAEIVDVTGVGGSFVVGPVEGNVLVSRSTFNDNDDDGLTIRNVASRGVGLFNVTALRNDPGVSVTNAGSFTDFHGNFSNNDDDGINLVDISGNVLLTGTTANDNNADFGGIGDGLFASDGIDGDAFAIGGTLTILGSTFRDTDGAAGAFSQINGVHILDGVKGNVLLADEPGGTSNTITGNRRDGFDLDGLDNANVTITNGTYSSNAGTGIEIDNADHVIVTNVTANNNGINGLDVDPTDRVDVIGGTFNNNVVDGIHLLTITTVNVSGNTVANNNGDDGLDLDDFVTATIGFLTTNANGNNLAGNNGMEIQNGVTLNVNDWETIGNDNNNTGNRPANLFKNIEQVNFTTTTVPDDTDDKIEIYETDFQHVRAKVKQDFVAYNNIGQLNFATEGGKDVFVIHENVSNPANSPDINLDGGSPSAGPNAFPGDKLVMSAFDGFAFYTDPNTGTGFAFNQGPNNTVDFTDIEDIVFADQFEFNNTLATATVLGSAMTHQLDASIHSVDDEDFFKVTAKKTGVLQVNLHALFGTYMDLDMQILDADGDVIATLDSITDNEFVAIPVVAQKVYHIRVYGKNNNNGECNFGNYSLEIENTPLAITPQSVHMDPASDTGMMNNDAVTSNTQPAFIIQADLDEIVDPNNDNVNDIAILTAAEATAGNVPGVAVWVQITNQTTGATVTGFASQIGGSDLFRFTPAPALGEGVYYITSAVQMVDGSTPNMADRGPLSVPLQFTIDTVAPAAAALDMLTSSDSDSPHPVGNTTDDLTKIRSPAFDGVAEANAKIRVMANGRIVGQAVVNADSSDGIIGNGLGTWEITVEPLTDGPHAMTLEIEDAAGNITKTGNLQIIVDALSPQRPTIDLVDVDDSGMSDKDNVTNDNTLPRFRVSAEPQSWVVIKDGETIIDSFVMPLAGFTVRTLNLAEGPHPLSTEAFDAAGNRSAQSQELLVTIDTIAPLAGPVTLDMLTSSDSLHPSIGTNVDDLTNIQRPAFDGVAEANAKIRVMANGRIVGQGVVNADSSDGDATNGLGTWEITIEPLVDGTHIITLEIEDAAGNITKTGNLQIVVDTLPPQRPTLDLVDVDDSGMSDKDGVTNDNTFPRFRVSAEVGSWVVIKDGETVIDSFVMPAAGFTIRSLNLAEGPHPLSTEAFDAAGNRSAQSQELLVTIDTIAPVTGAAPDLLTASDSGKNSIDNVTNESEPAFQGQGEANAKVRVYANGELVGEGVVNTNGQWEVTVEPLVDAVYSITTEFEDLAGNVSALSPQLQIVVDTVEPNTPYLDLLDDTGHSATDNITSDNTPRFTMTSEDPNILLAQVFFTDNLIFRIYDRYEGSEEFLIYDSSLDGPVDATDTAADLFTKLQLILETLPEQYFALHGDDQAALIGAVLADGVHNLKLEVEDRAGNISHDFLLPVTIDTTTLPIVTPVLLESSDTGMLNDDAVINEDEPAFMGVAEANAIVRIYARDVDTGTVQLVGENIVGSDLSDVGIGAINGLGGQPDDGYGLWEITVEPLDDGHYEMFVEVEDWAGNILTSGVKEIWVDTEPPNTPLLDLVTDTGRHDADNVTNDNTPDFEFTINDTANGGNNPFPNDVKYRLYLRPGDGSGEILVYDSWVANGNNFVTGGFFSHTIGAALNDGTVAIADGVYDFKLEVEDRAGNLSHDFLLNVTVDTTNPTASFGKAAVVNDGLHPDSDTGVVNQANLSADRVTSDTTPQFTGHAEADSIVRLYVITPAGSVLIGQTVATPLDGNKAHVQGEWSITSTVDLNDPSLGLPVDGVRRLLITVEDVAGNLTGKADGLEIFLDTRGPQVTNVYSTVDPSYNLFAPSKQDGPTPLMNSVTISFADLPERAAADFLYGALNKTLAQQIGNYTMVGDKVGNVAIVSAVVKLDPATDGNLATGTVELFFAKPLEDDRYTLTVSDNIRDDAGNKLDGESNASGNVGTTNLPSGDTNAGGDFVARFTVDTRPEIAVWGQSGVFIDANQTYGWDVPNALNTSYDVSSDMVFNIGVQTDQIFAGQFKKANAASVNGYDRIGAYGLFGGKFRFLLDTDDDGVIDTSFVSNVQVNGLPVAGNFDGNAANGDEIGLFDGTTWFLDTTGDNLLDTTFATGIHGLPIVGDFDGDGQDDLGTHIASSNTFFFDFASNGFGGLDDTFSFGTPGVSERPFAADFDQDGIDDFGLTTKNQSGVPGQNTLEWYIFRSGQKRRNYTPAASSSSGGNGYGKDGGSLPHSLTDPFSPTPLGDDLYTNYGSDIAAPVVGNFDPPAPPAAVPAVTGPSSTASAGAVNITWENTGAADYELLMYDTNAGQQVYLQAGLTGTSQSVNLAAGSYQVFVRATDGSGTATAWSSSLEFDVAGTSSTVLTVPKLTGPSSTASAGAVNITWENTGAADYELLMYDTNAGQQVYRQAGLTGTSQSVNLAAGSYQVFVRATDGSGTTTAWSSSLEFDVAKSSTKPLVPVLTGGSTTAITWTESSSAASYEILVYNMNLGKEIVHDTGLTGASYSTTSVSFVSGNRYQVFIRAIDSAGKAGAWSSALEFDVASVDSPIDADSSIENINEVLLQDATGNVETPIDLSNTVFTSFETVTMETVATQEVIVEGQTVAAEKTVSVESSTEEIGDIKQLDSVLADWNETEWWNDDATLNETTEGNSSSQASLLFAAAPLGIVAPMLLGGDRKKRTAKTHPQQRLQ